MRSACEAQMDSMLEFLRDNPLYAVGVVLFLVGFLFALLQKMFKMALLAALLCLGYLYYVHDLAMSSYSKLEKQVESVGEQAGDLADRAGKLIKH